MSTDAALTRITTKLQASIAEGEYYEAHQTYRSLYNRYLGAGKYDRCLILLAEGVRQFNEKGQTNSAVDLVELMVDTLSKQHRFVEDTDLCLFKTILSSLPTASTETPKADPSMSNGDSDVAEPAPAVMAGATVCMDRGRACQQLLAWSKAVSADKSIERKRGHHLVHGVLADVYYGDIAKTGSWKAAKYHYLHSRDAKKCAAFLVDYQQHEYPEHVDVVLVQFVVQMLCFQYTTEANETINEYARLHPSIKSALPIAGTKFTLINFVHLLNKAILDKKTIEVYAALIEKYMPEIEVRDDSLKPYLDKIGQLYFGVPPPQRAANPLTGMLGTLLKGMMGGGDEPEEMDSTPPSADSPREPVAKRAQMMEDDGLD